MPSADRKTAPITRETDLSSLDDEEARSLLSSVLTLDAKGGVLRVLDVRYAILRPVVIANIQKQLEQTVGASTKGFMYLAGEKSAETGFDVTASLVRGFKDEGMTLESFEWLADAMALLGYGRFDVRSFDREDDRLSIALENSPFAEAYGPSKKPVCHIVAGFLAGVGRRILARELLCEEISCKAQDKPQCEFELRATPSL